MKRLLTAALLLGGSLAYAQQAEYTELLRSDIRAKKMDLITTNMKFTDEESRVFFPIYRRYELELSKIWDVRVELIREYKKVYDSMTDAKAGELFVKQLDLRKKELALREAYYREFEKALPVGRVVKFFQVENRINLMVDLQIASELPPLK